MTPELMRSVVGSYFDACFASWPGGDVAPVSGWQKVGQVFSGQYSQYTYTYNTYYASYVEQMSSLWNSYFPPAALIHGRSAKPLDRAGDISTAAAWVGGCLGLGLAMVIGAPVELGVGAGIVIFGLGTYIYASLNSSLGPSDLATAIADASVPAGYIASAADLAAGVGAIQSVKGGYAPYGFLAGGIVGAGAYYYRKFYPQLFKQGIGGGSGALYPSNPSTINWIPVGNYHVIVTFDGTPLPQAYPL